ncbi:hypothetical protein KEM52_002827 [Ascosphaera acerosa]|nr:hypothetical protein KEM52_002827 [Ascosphaera acerosa]
MSPHCTPPPPRGNGRGWADYDDYDIDIQLQDESTFSMRRLSSPMTPEDLRAVLASQRRAYPSDAVMRDLLQRGVLRAEPDAREKEDLAERADT